MCDAEGEEAGESACHGGSREEEGLAELRFVAGIPHRDIIRNTYDLSSIFFLLARFDTRNIPGNSPASVTPKKTRAISKPS